MKKIIRKVLDELGDTQINLGSEAARKTIAALVSVALKDKGVYKKYISDELEEQKARETWVCSICGKNTYDVDWDYIGSDTNHLGCELEIEMSNKNDADYYTGPEPREKIGEDRRKGDRREREYPYNSFVRDKQEQIKARGVIRPKKRVKKKFDDLSIGITNEEKDFNQAVFGDSKDLTEARIQASSDYSDGWTKQYYFGQYTYYKDKLAEEILDNKDNNYLFESPDGGKTLYKRKFGSEERILVKDINDEHDS